MRAEPILAVLLLIAFFLPWVEGIEPVSGFACLKSSLGAAGGAGSCALPMADQASWLVYVFYAIPVGGVLTLLFGLANIVPRFFALLTGLAPWVLAVYAVVQGGLSVDDLTQIFGLGAYATLVIGALLVLCGLGVFRSRSRV